jgi:hypothetical protein
MLVRGVVDDELGDHVQAALMCGPDQVLDLGDGAVFGMNLPVFRDVVAVVLARGRIEGQKPNRIDPEARNVIELGHETGKVPDPVIVGIEERLHVELVDDRILVPEWI